MKNILQFDENFDVVLLVNEAAEANSIWLEVRTNDSTNQELEVMIDGDTAVIALASESVNKVELTNSYWNFGGTTSVRLVNDDTESEYVVIVFPEIITTDSALFPSAERQYSLQGQYNVEQAIDNLGRQMQGQIDDANSRIPSIIPPYEVNRNSISNGSTRDVITFRFNNLLANPTVILQAMLDFTVTTVVGTGDAYGDCEVWIYYRLDDSTVATIKQTYGDGKHILNLNYQITSALAVDNHTFVVRLYVTGGSLS